MDIPELVEEIRLLPGKLSESSYSGRGSLSPQLEHKIFHDVMGEGFDYATFVLLQEELKRFRKINDGYVQMVRKVIPAMYTGVLIPEKVTLRNGYILRYRSRGRVVPLGELKKKVQEAYQHDLRLLLGDRNYKILIDMLKHISSSSSHSHEDRIESTIHELIKETSVFKFPEGNTKTIFEVTQVGDRDAWYSRHNKEREFDRVGGGLDEHGKVSFRISVINCLNFGASLLQHRRYHGVISLEYVNRKKETHEINVPSIKDSLRELLLAHKKGVKEFLRKRHAMVKSCVDEIEEQYEQIRKDCQKYLILLNITE